MSDSLAIVTCTGDRPESFALLERWVADQTYSGDFEWIVVDDGSIATQVTMGQKYLRRERTTDDPPHTLPVNLKWALDFASHFDRVLFLEDDDYYAPGFIQTYSGMLDGFSIVGEFLARYYWLPGRRYWRHGNMDGSSLAQTGMRTEHLDTLRHCIDIVPGNPYIDSRFWTTIIKYAIGTPFVFADMRDGQPYHVSIKGVSGRVGLDDGHNGGFGQYRGDVGEKMIRRWVRNEKHLELLLDTFPRTEPEHADVDGIAIGAV